MPAPTPAFDSRQYQPLSKAAPDYPERALDKNIEGDCSVEYTVNTQGHVENPKVLDGCHPLFIRPLISSGQYFSLPAENRRWQGCCRTGGAQYLPLPHQMNFSWRWFS